MPHQVTPSRKKFRIARIAAKKLEEIYGEKVLMIFVSGSVAANVATPTSDIDIGYVLKVNKHNDLPNDKNYSKAMTEIEKISQKYGHEIHANPFSSVDLECSVWRFKFEKPKIQSMLGTMLKVGIVPLYGQNISAM